MLAALAARFRPLIAETLAGVPMSTSMEIEMAFFEGDNLLCRGSMRCGAAQEVVVLESTGGHTSEIEHQFEEPACPVATRCSFGDEFLYDAAMRVGVHDSEDWESINLGNVHTLAFLCRVDG